jgi:hypothetical protein
LIPEASDSVASRAFRSLISKYNKNENATVNIKFFEESSSGASTILLKRSMVAAARLWNQKNLPQEPYPVLIGRTLDWLKKSALENNLTPNFGWTNIENQFREWKECSYAEFYSTTGQPWYVFCYSQPAEQINKDLSFLQVGAHEYTHLIQFHLSNSFYRNNGDPLPPWLQEGFAMYVGTMLGGSTLVDNNLRIQLINQLKGTNSPLSDYKYRFPEKWNDIYPLGGFATEALVALKGIEVMEIMCSKLAEGKTSEQAILLATGKDLNYWTELGQGYVDSIKQGKPWTLDELRNKS